MALRKLKPTSPGQRFVVRVVKEGLHKGDPYEPLLEPFKKRGGRNNQGRITTRHQGGGHKRYYRVIDFKRDKDGIAGKIERLEYDPNRTAYLALVLYAGLGAAEVIARGHPAAVAVLLLALLELALALRLTRAAPPRSLRGSAES